MPNLHELLPKKSSFEIILNNGKTHTLHLRPYNLRDEAYLRENFDLNTLQEKLSGLDPMIISKLVWRQLTPESKKIFDKIKVVDDSGKELDVDGHIKFMESFGGVAQILNAFNAVMTARGINSVIDSISPSGSKKKTFWDRITGR